MSFLLIEGPALTDCLGAGPSSYLGLFNPGHSRSVNSWAEYIHTV